MGSKISPRSFTLNKNKTGKNDAHILDFHYIFEKWNSISLSSSLDVFVVDGSVTSLFSNEWQHSEYGNFYSSRKFGDCCHKVRKDIDGCDWEWYIQSKANLLTTCVCQFTCCLFLDDFRYVLSFTDTPKFLTEGSHKSYSRRSPSPHPNVGVGRDLGHQFRQEHAALFTW